MTIPFQELEGSPQLTMDRSGGTKGQRIFLCDWTQLNTALADLFPYPWEGFTELSLFPGFGWMLAHTAKFEPFDPSDPDGTGQSENTYTHAGAKITVDYEWADWKDGVNDKNSPGKDKGPTNGEKGTDDNPVTVTWETAIGGEFLVLPQQGVQWATDPEGKAAPPGPVAPGKFDLAENVHCGIVIPTLEHTITWHFCFTPPWDNIRYCVGKVNSNDFLGAPEGTLLFAGAEVHREWDQNGTKTCTLKYKFSEKNMGDSDSPKGWNYFFRPETGQFELLVKKSDGDPMYGDAGFTSLFNATLGPVTAP
jgi:hypothetical protein